MEAEDKRFILDIVCGCVEHNNLLDIVINVFYAQNGKCLSRGDRHQFSSKWNFLELSHKLYLKLFSP